MRSWSLIVKFTKQRGRKESMRSMRTVRRSVGVPDSGHYRSSESKDTGSGPLIQGEYGPWKNVLQVLGPWFRVSPCLGNAYNRLWAPWSLGESVPRGILSRNLGPWFRVSPRPEEKCYQFWAPGSG